MHFPLGMKSQLPAQVAFWVSLIAAFLGLRIIHRELRPLLPALGIGRIRLEIRKVFQRIQEIEETLAAGIVPSEEQWEGIRNLPSPWGSVAFESVRELRTTGGALLPTLGRLRELADFQSRALSEARARSAQAQAQALCCGLLAPAFGIALYLCLPGVSDSPALWLMACGGALLFAGVGALWLLSLMEEARWAGLPPGARAWIFAAQCAGERFLALVRAGNPADIAWTRSCELLSREAPELAREWGSSIWKDRSATRARGSRCLAEEALIGAGDSIRKAVQLSLMEGRPCLERVEATLGSLRHEIQSQVERELSLLSTRALKPLFLCVAPPILGLLALGLYLSWRELAGSGGMP